MSKNAADEYTFGIEEEFFLVDLRTRQLPIRVPKQLVKLCQEHLGEEVTYEFQQAQIEIATPILNNSAQASHELSRLRSGVSEIARTMGFGIVAAGTHPLASWNRLHHTDKPRYNRIMKAFQMIGRRDVLCGLHVHVAVPSGIDRVALMNRFMPWLPLFLALSTSSPFWNRRRTGVLSYRLSVYDEWPRTGIPDFFNDEADYADFIARLVKAGALKDGSELWWAIRPSVRFPTLELRIADACTDVVDTVALATLFRCLIRAHIRCPELGAQRSTGTRRIIEENRWRAQRYGIEAEFIDEIRNGCISVTQQLEQAFDLIAPELQLFNCGDLPHLLRRILTRGTSAHQQLACYKACRDAGANHLDALRATVDWLLETTLAGQIVASKA